MKKFILPVLVLSTVLFSCKKDDNAPSCEVSVTGIAATFKVTKVELVATGGTSDVSSSYLGDDCERNAIYQLKNDRSFVYTEISSSCTGSSVGTWNVANNNITISAGSPFDVTSAVVDSWDCSSLKVKTPFAGGSLVYTFSKQ